MTNTEKRKINETIAEAMEEAGAKMPLDADGWIDFDPCNCISTAMKIVKTLGLTLSLYTYGNAADAKVFDGKTFGKAEAKTPETAISLALHEYIKSKRKNDG